MSSSKVLNPQCHHSEQYEISTDGEPVPELPYPSRLGFLQTTESGTTIRFIDLNKNLCRNCCDSLIPDGKYLVWSVLAGASAANVVATLAALVPGDGHFPPILKAGSELKDTLKNVSLSIPDLPEAEEAWKWLETQDKPFYIDQLHMVVGRNMTPLARKRAAKDSAVALRYGEVFNPDLVRSLSTTSHFRVDQHVQLDQGTQDTSDFAPPVKEKTVSKKSSTNKKSDGKKSKEEKPSKKNSVKKSDEKQSDGKPSKNKSEDTVSDEKSSIKKSKKNKNDKKDKEGAQPTEVISSPEKQVSESSTVLRKPKDRLEASGEPCKTISTDTLNEVASISGTISTPNLTPEPKKLKSNPGGATNASTSAVDTKGASLDIDATPGMTTTVKTFSRSWAWSEPFEFATGTRKVPALSDYERVAESRAPPQHTANSLYNFFRQDLELDAPRKLLGPGDFTHTASRDISSSLMKPPTASQLSESKASGSKGHGNESSAKKTNKDSDAKSKPKKSTVDSSHSGSSESAKPAKSQEMGQWKSPERSTTSKKMGQLGLGYASNSSQDRKSEQSKAKIHNDTSSTSSHQANSKSVARTQEIHEKSIKVKSSSDGPGIFSDLSKAGANYFAHKLNEATEKTHKKDKDEKDKLSKPDHKPQGQSEPEFHEPSQGNGPRPSEETGANQTQPSPAEQPGTNQPSDAPTQDDLPDEAGPTTQADPISQAGVSTQTGPPIGTGPSVETQPPVTIGHSDSTQSGQIAGTGGPVETVLAAEGNMSLQASAQGSSDLCPPSQLPSQAGGAFTSNQPTSVSATPVNNTMMVAAESPAPARTGERIVMPSYQAAAGFPTPPNGLGTGSPMSQSVKYPHNRGDGHHAIDNLIEGEPLLNQPATHASLERPFSGDGIGVSGNSITSTKPIQEPIKTGNTPSDMSSPEVTGAPASSGLGMPQSSMDQAHPGRTTFAPGLKPLHPSASNLPNEENELSGRQPEKNLEMSPGAGSGAEDHDHTAGQEPKRSHTKLGGQTGHEKPGRKPKIHPSKIKPEHHPKRPNAGSSHKRPSGVGVAAGVLAGVALGATVAAVAANTGSDDDSSSDSDSDKESTHSEWSGDDDGSVSEANDENDSLEGESMAEEDQSDDSGDETPGDDEEDTSAGESDGGEDQDLAASDSDSEGNSSPEQADDSGSEGLNSDDDDEDVSVGNNSSEGENSESESEASGNESEASSNEDTDQDSSGLEDNSDEDPEESSSDAGDDESGEEDGGDTEQEASSNEENSDLDDDEVSDSQEFSDDD
ncbi:hypothetical protein KVR01_004766 [Diaporthe batatas]|uniref:uncharacterized protein n=1 Tax=Diaporthe batatas TaxID=748121 RepID=UPI001D0549EF|nr:uncharacterized protein KVR01_004766 [Diaporthe batatas]KAG8166214.1 hypothetical protein KVR01_004766 [Diaporthe batatas]